MPNIVIVGAQWGDEGKGKVVDLLAARVQVVARYNGGHNAGHTVIVRRAALRPAPRTVGDPAPGRPVRDRQRRAWWTPWRSRGRSASSRRSGVEVGENLLLSDRAHLILPHHRGPRGAREEARGARKIGTTLRGIGPAYEDKAGRRGVTLGDLLRPGDAPGQAGGSAPALRAGAARRGPRARRRTGSGDAELAAFGERHRSRITDVSLVLHRQMAQGYSVLFEGAQGALLDLDHGTYPYVTCSSAAAGGAATGTGVPPTRIDGVLGVAKAYCTRVGAGPFPTELDGRPGDAMRERGGEYGATTGRPRRCGWFDAVAVRYAVRLNGFDTLAITKLDVLDELEEISVCTGYLFEGALLDEMPADSPVLEACEPVYETLAGWRSPSVGAREWRDLPENARRYVERLGELAGVEIGVVSTGPDREETILRAQSALARWFE